MSADERRWPGAGDGTAGKGIESESVPTVPEPLSAEEEAARESESQALLTALLSARAEEEARHETAEATRDEPPVGSLIAGRYELVKRVAGGSMGVVYKALDRQATIESHEPAWVALKLLRADLERHGTALRALQQEAETGLFLDHPNIVRFRALERDHDRFFIIMEWLPGRSLAEWLDAHPGEPMPMPQVLAILRELGAALEYAHEQGVVHADVKPGNVMLLPGGSVRLCDFGIARFDTLLASRSGSFDPAVLRAATPAYSSPEVLRGETPQVEDDVFSLACLTYRLLSGRRVFGQRDAAAAAEAGARAEPIAGLEPARWEALSRALSLQRGGRQTSVRRFVTEFAGTEAPPLGRVGKGRTAAVSLLLAVTVAVVWMLLPEPIGDPRGRDTRLSQEPAPAVPDELPVVASPPPAGASGPPGGAPIGAESDVPPGAQVASMAATPGPAEPVESVTGRPDPEDDPPPVAPAAAGAIGTPAEQRRPAVILDLATAERRGSEAELRLQDTEGTVLVRLRRGADLSRELPLSVDRQVVADRAGPPLAVVLPPPETLRFAAGAAELDLPLRLAAGGGGTALRLVLRGPDGARLGSLTLRAEERLPVLRGAGPDIVGFRSRSLSVREDATVIRVELIRYNAGGGALAVDLRTVDGTAEAGEDFIAPGGRPAQFAAGETRLVVYLPLIDDAEREPPEYLRVLLDAPAPAPGVQRELIVEIDDDD